MPTSRGESSEGGFPSWRKNALNFTVCLVHSGVFSIFESSKFLLFLLELRFGGRCWLKRNKANIYRKLFL